MSEIRTHGLDVQDSSGDACVAYVVRGWRGRIRLLAICKASLLFGAAHEVTAFQRMDVAVAVETSGLVCASGGVVGRHFCMR